MDDPREPLHAIGVRAWEALVAVEDEDDDEVAPEVQLPVEARAELERDLARVSIDELPSAVRSLVTVAQAVHARGYPEPAKQIVEIAVAAKLRLTLERDPGSLQDEARAHRRQMASLRGERLVETAPLHDGEVRPDTVPLERLLKNVHMPAGWRTRR